MNRLLLATLLLASCGPGSPPDLQISDAWARETVAGQTSTAAYMTIANRGGGDDRLVAVTAPEPMAAALHATERSGSISRMREMASGLAIPSGSAIELRPGSTHIMLTGVSGQLQPGTSLKLRLKFERSGDRTIDVRVASAAGPQGGH